MHLHLVVFLTLTICATTIHSQNANANANAWKVRPSNRPRWFTRPTRPTRPVVAYTDYETTSTTTITTTTSTTTQPTTTTSQPTKPTPKTETAATTRSTSDRPQPTTTKQTTATTSKQTSSTDSTSPKTPTTPPRSTKMTTTLRSSATENTELKPTTKQTPNTEITTSSSRTTTAEPATRQPTPTQKTRPTTRQTQAPISTTKSTVRPATDNTKTTTQDPNVTKNTTTTTSETTEGTGQSTPTTDKSSTTTSIRTIPTDDSLPFTISKFIKYKIGKLSDLYGLPFKSLTEIFAALNTYNIKKVIKTGVRYQACPKLYEKSVKTAADKLLKTLKRQIKQFKRKDNQVCFGNRNGKYDCDECCKPSVKKNVSGFCQFCVCVNDVSFIGEQISIASSSTKSSETESIVTATTSSKDTDVHTTTNTPAKMTTPQTSDHSSQEENISGENSATLIASEAESTPHASIGSNNERYRRRRSTNGMTEEEQAVLEELNLHNTLGARATLRTNCLERGSGNDRNTVNMCRSCQYDINLPSDHYPESFIHTTCGNGEDISCFTSEGVCSKVIVVKPVLKWKDDGGYQEFHVPVTIGCACEIIKGSIMEVFV